MKQKTATMLKRSTTRRTAQDKVKLKLRLASNGVPTPRGFRPKNNVTLDQ